MLNSPPAYPAAEIRVVPRRRRRPWIAILGVAAIILVAAAWLPRAKPHPVSATHSTAAVVRQPAARPAPAKAGVSVTVGRTVYACTIRR